METSFSVDDSDSFKYIVYLCLTHCLFRQKHKQLERDTHLTNYLDINVKNGDKSPLNYDDMSTRSTVKFTHLGNMTKESSSFQLNVGIQIV